MLAEASKTPMQAVHYRGEAPMIQDLISGQVDFAASNIIRSHVEAGTLRVLATTGDKRWFAFPDAPTLKELGYTVEYYAWSGFVAPAGTPQAVVDRINKSANIALAEQDVIKALTANGFEIVGGKPEIFAKAMSSYIRPSAKLAARTISKSSSATSRVTRSHAQQLHKFAFHAYQALFPKQSVTFVQSRKSAGDWAAMERSPSCSLRFGPR